MRTQEDMISSNGERRKKQAFSWIHARLLSEKMQENFWKRRIISVRLPNGERWKICVSLNSLAIAFLGKCLKTGENFCECGNALCFPYVNRAVNSGKQWVLRNLTIFAILENKGKCRFSNVNPRWTWSFTPGKHLWTQANKAFAKLTDR